MTCNTDISSNYRRRSLFLACLLAISGPAWSQEEATTDEDDVELDRIVVTGSRISRAQAEGPSPVISMSSEQMQQDGFTTVYEALNTLTQNVSNTQDDQFAGGFTQNANVVDLRGLGPGRTLILINGRRTTDYPLPFNGQSNIVNLASIPLAAVDRIEVLAGGASAVYGSDAIAGVINVIMKESVEGFDVRLRYGDTSDGGGESVRLQFVGGLGSDRFNLTYALEYFDRDPIWAFERDYMDSVTDDPDGAPFVNARNVLALDNYDFYRVGSQGLRYIAPDASACDNFNNLEYSFRPGAGYFCGSDDDIAQTTVRNGTENYSAFLNAHYELTDTAELFGYLSYIDKKSEFNVATLLWQSNLYGPNNDGFNTLSNLDTIVQYDLSDFDIGVIDWPQVTVLQRIFTAEEMGGRDVNNNFFDEESIDAAVGVNGWVFDTWNYELTLSHSEYELERQRRLIHAEAADAFFAGDSLANLQPDPLFGGFYAHLGDLTDPDNRFNRPLTPAEFMSISGVDTTTADSSNTTASLSLTGDLFEMNAGAVGVAAVLEWGTQDYQIDLDPRLVNGEWWGYTGTGGGGDRDRYALGVEALVPLHEKFTVTAATRYDKYDDVTEVDDAVTYGLGLEFRPTDNLLLRGRYATSFRAPDMHYVFANPSGFFVTVPDYYLCARDLGVDESSPGGIASACVDPIRGPLGTSSPQGFRSGNTFLEEEEGESYTVGFVWQVTDGLSLTADYYDIRLENIVVDRSVDTLLRDERGCRLGAPYTVTPGTDCAAVLSKIVRNPAGTGVNSETLVSVNTGPFNQAVQETNGIDASLSWAHNTDRMGLFTVDLGYTYVFDQKAATLPTDPVVSYQDDGTQDLKSRARGSFGWAYESVAATLFMNYLGSSLTNDSLFSDTKNRVDAQTYWNATVQYAFTDALSLTLIGNNILNEEPPLTSEEEYPYFNIFNYDPYGRELFLELTFEYQ